MAETKGLIYVPILHTQREAAAIGGAIKDCAPADGKNTRPPERQESITDMWGGIACKLTETNIPCRSFRIYQDALPVCGMERSIVEKLAAKDSPNHRLVLELLGRDARLEGTEDPDLLVAEYDALSKLLQGTGLKDDPAALALYRAESNRLMEKRDAFIAGRIRSTIRPGETPLVFMGVRHKLEKLLEADFVVAYIIYRLPFKKVRDIYT
ncbi:MAG: hypothetical protein WCK75_03515 [Elusimicrobiota bacterium]